MPPDPNCGAGVPPAVEKEGGRDGRPTSENHLDLAPFLPGSDILALALAEDIGPGDITTLWFTPQEKTAGARIIAKQNCVLAGAGVAEEVFTRVDASLNVKLLRRDGDILVAGDPVLAVAGRAASILTAERTALNFIQRLSGVATMARRYVDATVGTGAVILDTRKTTPGMRSLEKAAVAAAGATNHRMGLYDMALVKDNHLATGSSVSDLQKAIGLAKAANPLLRIEIEADTLDQAKAFFEVDGVDIVLLDNMPLDSLREAVRLRPPGILLEASGGVTLETVRAIAETGVDFISVGALTHSAPSVDFSLELEPGQQSTP